MKGTFLNLTFMALVIMLVFFNKGAMAMEKNIEMEHINDPTNPDNYTCDDTTDSTENKNKDTKLKMELILRNQGYVVPQQSSESCTECQAYGIPFVLYNLMWITMVLVRKSNCIYENGEYVPEYTDADGYKTPGYYPHIYEGGNYSKNTCENLSHGTLLLIAFEVFLCMCWLKAKEQ